MKIIYFKNNLSKKIPEVRGDFGEFLGESRGEKEVLGIGSSKKSGFVPEHTFPIYSTGFVTLTTPPPS